MNLLDLIVAVLFIALYFVLWHRHQFTALTSAVSLLVTVLFSASLATAVDTALLRYGFISDGYPVVIAYLLIVIIIWGILFAVLSNFKTEKIENYKIITPVFIAIIFSIAASSIICTVSSYILTQLEPSNSYLCRICRLTQINSHDKGVILIPAKLDEAINLNNLAVFNLENGSIILAEEFTD